MNYQNMHLISWVKFQILVQSSNFAESAFSSHPPKCQIVFSNDLFSGKVLKEFGFIRLNFGKSAQIAYLLCKHYFIQKNVNN